MGTVLFEPDKSDQQSDQDYPASDAEKGAGGATGGPRNGPANNATQIQSSLLVITTSRNEGKPVHRPAKTCQADSVS